MSDRTPSVLARTGSVLWRTAGWSALVLLLGGEVVDRSGITRALARGALERRLGGEVRLGGASMQWLGRTLVLRRLELGSWRLERVEVTLGRPWRPLGGVSAVHVRGGRVVLDDPPGGEGTGEPSEFGLLPDLTVEDLRLALSPSRGDGADSPLELGRLSLALAREGPGQDDGLVLTGRVERARDAGTTASLDVSARARPDGSDLRARLRGSDLPLELLASALGRPGLLREGRLDLDLELAQEPGDSLPRVRGGLRASVGRLEPGTPWPAVEDLVLEAELDGRRPAEVAGWSGCLGGRARLVGANGEGLELQLGGRLDEVGRADLWGFLPAVPVGPELRELLPGLPGLEELEGMLEPRGTVDLRVAASHDLGASLDPRRTRLAATVDPAGRTSIAYRGRTSPRGVRDLGFPLRGRQVRGRVLLGHASGATDVGLVELSTAAQDANTVHGSGALHQTAPAPGEEAGAGDFQLILSTPGLVLDGEVREALEGLSGVVPPRVVWERYRPAGGSTSARVELWAGDRTPGVAARVELGFAEVSMAWSPLPVPVEGLRGRLEVVSDGQRSFEGGAHVGVSLELHGRSPVASGPLTVEVFVRETLVRERREDPLRVLYPAEWLRVEVEGVDPSHPELVRALESSQLEMLKQILAVDVEGKVDLHVRRGREPDAEEGLLTVEATPLAGTIVRPPGIDLTLGELEGRLLARLPDDRGGTPVLRLEGAPLRAWARSGEDVLLQLAGGGSSDGRLDLVLDAAGLDTHAGGLLAGLLEDTGRADLAAAEVRLEAELDGRVRARRAAPAGNDAAPPELLVDAFVHRGALLPPAPDGATQGAALLEDLEGRLWFDGTRLGSERLTARLGGTELELTALEAEPAAGRLAVDLGASEVSLDRATLAPWVPAPVLDALLGDLAFRSQLDRVQARLEVQREGELQRVELEGSLVLGPTSLDLGLPVSLGTARVPRFGLGLENGKLGLWAQVEDLFGRVAGRSLDRTRLLLSFAQGHLSVRDLEGRFADGSLAPLGLESQASKDLFSLYLAPPYPFVLSARLEDVEAGELLRGLFRSNFANRGRLDGELRLAGDLGRLTEIEGRGRLRLVDSSLWAIPVFQALFSQLGFETTATFQRMEAAFQVEGGRIGMRDMRLESDLLSLVGNGWVDLDGRVSTDLEVRYSLVDRLGPLNYLVYLVQNGLLRVFVRGDLARPRVQLGGVLSLLLGRRGEVELALPLPGPGPLPARF